MGLALVLGGGNVFRNASLGKIDGYGTRTDWQRDVPLPVAAVKGKCRVETLHRPPATGTHLRLLRPRGCSCQEFLDGLF
jgi:hypothetical protein